MTERQKDSCASMRKISPKFTVAFAAGNRTPPQSPNSSPEVTASDIDDMSAQAHSKTTPPLRTKLPSAPIIDYSITCSPLRLDESIRHSGEGIPNSNDRAAPVVAQKRSLQTAFAGDTTVSQHQTVLDMDRKRFAFAKSREPSPSLSSSPHRPLNSTESVNTQADHTKPHQIPLLTDPNSLTEGNLWSVPGFDTKSALAALSVAYSSLFRNSIPLNPSAMHSAPFTNIPHLPLSDALPKSSNACNIPCSNSNPSAPLLLTLSDPQTATCFPAKGHEKSPMLLSTSNLAQSGQDPLPTTMSNLLSDNLDCWQQFQQAAYANNLDPHVLALYNNAGCAFELSGTSRRKNATRETTSMLKAWLNEHRKNPYPTKGEKIMLAIVTKMSLTQVSTWFANARRRLKKENKVTWNVRNTSSSDAGQDSNGEDDDLEPDFDESLEMEKISGLMNARSRNQDGLSSPYLRHPAAFHSTPLANAEHRLRNKFPVSSAKPTSNSEIKLNSKSHQFRPYLSQEEQHRKIWSLVELAQNSSSRDVDVNSPHSNPEIKTPPVSGPHQSASFCQSEHEKSLSTPLNNTTVNTQPGTPPKNMPITLECNKITGSVAEASPYQPQAPNTPFNLLNDQRNIPLLSPAALAMFYMYYQQQQQQQQASQSQLQQQQPLIPQIVNPVAPKHLSDLEQYKTINQSKQWHIHNKDKTGVNPITVTPAPFNSNRLSAPRWPLMNGYVVGQLTGSQSDH